MESPIEQVLLLDKSADKKQIEQEEKHKFLLFLLEQLGIPLNEFQLSGAATPTVDDRIKLRTLLSGYQVNVEDLGNEYKVIAADQMVGSLKIKPYVLKRDFSLPKDQQLYVEMKLEVWTIFEI